MKTLEEIYHELFLHAFQIRAMMMSEPIDTTHRKANIMAVKETANVWRAQFKGK